MEKDSVAKRSMRMSLEDSVQKVLDILEKEDGRTFEEKKAEAIQYLRAQTDAAFAEILLRIAEEDVIGTKMKRKFWKQGDTIRGTDAVVLRDVKESDKPFFYELRRQYSMLGSMSEEESCREMIWKEHISCKSLMCSIENNGVYVGYCGIKNLGREKWEIAIEILKEWTHQGIGYAAVKALVDEIKKRLGVAEFLVQIAPENYASQRLFEKLGAVPNGIAEFMLHREEDIARCENENLDSINDSLIEVAEKFGVEPRRLLSHVLEYRLTNETAGS